MKNTDTPIRVKHNLVLEMRYRLMGTKEEKTLGCSTKITIASVC